MKLGEGPGGKGGANAIAKGGALKRGVPPLFGGPRDNKGVGRTLLPPERFGGSVTRLHRRRAEALEEAKRKQEAENAAAKKEQDDRDAREQERERRWAAEREQQRQDFLQLGEQIKKQLEERAAARQSQQEEPE